MELRFKVGALAPLVVDLDPVHDGIFFVGAFFVGHDDVAEVIEIGNDFQDEGDHSCDRDMAVVVSLLIHLKELWVYMSLDDKSWKLDLL